MFDIFLDKYIIFIIYIIIIVSIIGCICCYIITYKRQKKLQRVVAPCNETLHVNPMRIKQEKIMRLI
jgi:uncharacterized membrane protein (DUF373 family)